MWPLGHWTKEDCPSVLLKFVTLNFLTKFVPFGPCDGIAMVV